MNFPTSASVHVCLRWRSSLTSRWEFDRLITASSYVCLTVRAASRAAFILASGQYNGECHQRKRLSEKKYTLVLDFLLQQFYFFVAGSTIELSAKLGEQSLGDDGESVCTLPDTDGSVSSGFGDVPSEQRRSLSESLRKDGFTIWSDTIIPLWRFYRFRGC